MEEGREPTTVEATLVRIAEAVEKLATEPEVEIEAGPPVCPNCGQFDPWLKIAADEGGLGPMSQVCVIAACTECGSDVFIIIDSYSVHKSRTTAVAELEERKKLNGSDVRRIQRPETG